MNSLVTGGAGFIGSHVADQLLQRGHRVTILDDLSGGFLANVPASSRFVEGSINDLALIEKLFAEDQYDFVFHLAAYAAEGLSHFIKRFNYTNNLLGSVNLLNSAVHHRIKCFVFTSSIAVYGSCPDLPMSEESLAVPEDPYGIAKLAVEQELRVCHKMFGLNHIVFRPHNVYGERQNIGDRYRNVVGIFMNQILQGLPMSVFGDGRQSRAFSYIGDVAPLIALSVESPAAYNQVFNIGADQPCTVEELAVAVARAMGVEPAIRYFPAREEVLHAYSRHEKLNRLFPGRATTALEEGLRRMAEWVKQHGARSGKPFGEIELWENFPQAWQDLSCETRTAGAR